MIPTWTSTCTNICEQRPLLRRVLEGGCLNPTLSLGLATMGSRKHMKQTPPSIGTGAPNLFYCRPTGDKGAPCHAPDCDGQSACMLQLQRKQKTKDCQELKHPSLSECPFFFG